THAKIPRFTMSKRAIITGITGQDGSYLAELLLTQGYEVVGTVRRASAPNFWRIQHLLERITIKPADLLDQLSLIRLVDEVRPHEFYNLAATASVRASCSITSRRGAAWNSSRGRSPTRSRESSWGSPTRCRSATSRPTATGALPATTSGQCGSCCSRSGPTTT